MSAFFLGGGAKKSDAIIRRHDVIVNFFDVVVFLLSSLVTDPCFMPISLLVLELRHFVYNRFDQKSGTRNTSAWVWVLSNIWRLERIRDNKFGVNVPNENLLIMQNARFTAFAVSELLKEKQEIPPPRSELNHCPSCVFKSYLSKIRLKVGHSPNWHFLWLLIIENFRFG